MNEVEDASVWSVWAVAFVNYEILLADVVVSQLTKLLVRLLTSHFGPVDAHVAYGGNDAVDIS